MDSRSEPESQPQLLPPGPVRRAATVLMRGVAVLMLLAVIAAGAVFAYGYHLQRQSPIALMACAAQGMPGQRWACEQVLLRRPLSVAEVAWLNAHAGARLPLLLCPETRQAERLLDRLLAAGVDIDARDAHGLTALHTLVRSNRSADRVALLLARGARVDLAGPEARSALDMAMITMGRRPTRGQAQVIQLLTTRLEALPATASGPSP